MKLAIMQPYFVPYTGYFRLFLQADLFVILDDVQFPRRGWVHRNKLVNQKNQYSWLTLPLKKEPQKTNIKDMYFLDEAELFFNAQLSKFKVFQDNNYLQNDIFKYIKEFKLPLIDYLELTLKNICEQLNIEFNVIRSSSLDINNNLYGSERIIEIIQIIGASTYINSPGGKHLYIASEFENKGIKLEILPDWKGTNASILQRLLTEDIYTIRKELL